MYLTSINIVCLIVVDLPRGRDPLQITISKLPGILRANSELRIYRIAIRRVEADSNTVF